MKSLNHSKNIEALSAQPSICLYVFRHDEKDLAENDHIAPLTAKGRINAINQGKLKCPKLNQGYVITSPRERALHSGLLQFFGPSLPNLEEADLNNILEQIAEHANHIITDERLNFHVESHPEFNQRFYDEYNKKEHNDTLGFQLNHSDELILDLAKKTNPQDFESSQAIQRLKGYKRMVGDMAELILEYVYKLPVWESEYSTIPQNYDQPELQIFMGTHSQNIECFLLKLIEIQEGTLALQSFLHNLPHQKSFIDYSEGFSLKIYSDQDGQVFINLDYQNYHWVFTSESLQQLVKERKEFDLEVNKQLQNIPLH